MTQTLILSSLSRYTITEYQRLVTPLLPPENKNFLLHRRQRLLDLLEILQAGGHCFGFSLCYSSMAYLGIEYLNWWEAVLCAIAAWDGAPEKLSAIIQLPNLPPPHQNQPTTLEQLINKTLDYIVTHQHPGADIIPLKAPEGKYFSQNTILQPSTHFFELLDNQGNVKKITDTKMVSGHFSTEMLYGLLDEKNINGFICLLNNSGHSISLSFHESRWRLYDPNYLHTQNTIHKEFDNKYALIVEIHKILGNKKPEILGCSMHIIVSSLNAQKSNINLSYESCIKKSAITLISHGGIGQIAQHSPEYLLPIIRASADTSVESLIRQILTVSQLVPSEEIDSSIHLAKVLALQNMDGKTGLRQIAIWAKEGLLEILDYAGKTSAGCAYLAKALASCNKGNNALQYMANYGPKTALAKMIDLIGKTQEGCIAIITALAQKDMKENTGFRIIAILHPDMLEKILEYVAKTSTDIALIAEHLEVIIRFASNILENLAGKAIQDTDSYSLITKLLLAKSKEGNTGLEIIADLHGYKLEKILSSIFLAKDDYDFLVGLLTTDNKDGSKGLEIIAKSTPRRILDKIMAKILIAPYASDLIIKLLTAENLHNPALHIFARHTPQKLELILNSALQAPNGCMTIAKALSRKSHTRSTGLSEIARYNPLVLRKIADFLPNTAEGAELILKILSSNYGWKLIKNNVRFYHVRPVKKAIINKFNACLPKMKEPELQKLWHILTTPANSLYQKACIKNGLFCSKKPTKISVSFLEKINQHNKTFFSPQPPFHFTSPASGIDKKLNLTA